ncbi:molybdopterin molybdotransferase MoeA [Helicobacter sp. MIT 21-1697]|uniref:molybdopterin molybdotransferase MoeA n=1 Tax=Helicobacter sp. MIT 21-1697 TaxID=2993733 RepID=UPI00224AAFC4|nr:molybdopterin molybdotransferase MoeA [Helicobacter sp. MIT 21-1697]MCX2717913.1 molybdopterin molybdotransferase MoeA [Helicobacter sp. MIT 21-1697]
MTTFNQALQIGTSLPHTTRIHTLPLFESCGAILAQDIIATRPLPAFDNSAMDGYAIRMQDYGTHCICNGSILAGDDSSALILRQGHTYKVMTGSMLPQNTQAVVQIEWVQENETGVYIPAPNCKQNLTQGQNIRLKGEEIAQNSLLLQKGKRLNHLDLSIIASQGIAQVQSFAPLHIGIYSSGDEVIEPHQNAKAHQIYNTNATSLYSLLQQRGFKCEYRGILQDDKKALCAAIEQFHQYDVIITSGGASVGDADLIKEVLKAQGAKMLFDGINVKPGRHLALATLGKTLIILLPGNPLALLLHLHTLILSILESLQGASAFFPQSLTFKLNESLKLKANTTSMILGRCENETFFPHNGGKIGSSSLTTMWRNNAIALFDNVQSLPKGTPIKVILYNADFCDIIDFLNY